MKRRVEFWVTGVVQGVGFRPFVYGLAARLGLAGTVANTDRGVLIEVEGEDRAINAFRSELRASPPPLAQVDSVQERNLDACGATSFTILTSVSQADRTVFISPDYAVCPECLRDMRNPADRRYRYPFVNCTQCGPRYTIIRDLPYDRSRTTMAPFVMCADCQREYESPENRRHHAEPTCCPRCGPRVWLADDAGSQQVCDDPVGAVITLLAGGAVVAIKGLGGFHLACDATSEEAVATLRARKVREQKPLAVMVRDMGAATLIAEWSGKAENLLGDKASPIVLGRKRANSGIAPGVAPGVEHFGVMLPYTPLHHLLMEGPYRGLVMTSGNRSDEPIAHDNEKAVAQLAGIADAYLMHDRAIHIRTDDSVIRLAGEKTMFLRRSRGYAPSPVKLPMSTNCGEVVAVGAEMKNTVCFTRKGFAFLSHHLGDLRNSETYDAFLQALTHLAGALNVHPKTIACDRHPDYLSTRYAEETGWPLVRVQHHHAHIASVLAEHGRTGRAIGVAYDGLGWGENGEVWGGEWLLCDLSGYRRVGHLSLTAMPGGDAATRHPDRMAYAFLKDAFGENADELAEALLPTLSPEDRASLRTIVDRDGLSPRTSSMGRLFDAASALLGICTVNAYEGQGPTELEAHALTAAPGGGHYDYQIRVSSDGMLVVETPRIIQELVMERAAGRSPARCAARFHSTVARFTADMCARIREESGLNTVALSGGVWANALLLQETLPLLEDAEFEVLLNTLVPPGDGGVSLGQAAIAAWSMQCA